MDSELTSCKNCINRNALELQAEDLECAHLWLDDMGVPRLGWNGEELSFIGRILEYKTKK